MRFPPWKVDTAVVRCLRDIVLYGCLNVEPVQKARPGCFSDKYCVRELASEIKVALPWCLRLSNEELMQIIRTTEGVTEEKTKRGVLVSLHLGHAVARFHRKGLALQRKKDLVIEGWLREDDAVDWRDPNGGRAAPSQRREAENSTDESSFGSRM